MLSSLHIENIAVIRRAELELKKGFSVLSGETGAGKSMIIDSLNLLLGNRVSREVIRSGETYATVSAVFEDLSEGVCARLASLGFPREDGTLMLQRTLHADGRSQTRLDGQIITQTLQKEIARMLVSIHGQSDNQKLLQKGTHRELLDAYLDAADVFADYETAYSEWQTVFKKTEHTRRDDAERVRLAEMLKYQIQDIDSLRLKDGEEERLTAERDRLLHAEQINRLSLLSYRALRGAEKGNAYDLIHRAQNALSQLEEIIPDAAELVERLDTAASEIEDIAETVSAYAEADDGDPTARIDRLEGRLEEIAKCKRKYGATVADVLAFRESAAAQLDELEISDERRLQLEAECKRLYERARIFAARLTERRRAAAEEIVASVTQSLAFLDMPKVRFEISIKPTELSPHGADDIEFLIATNPGEPLLPMIKIASGGELSRIMLALRSVLNDRDGAATVVFDEVDTGVSGKTSRKIGIKLRESARNAQVLCVTHAAQIASLADSHYRISKEERDGRAETAVTLLDDAGRIEEVARILGGIEVTRAQRDAAREMIEEYRS